MRNSVPEFKTRWVIFDIKNMRLYSWTFFPTYEHALEWWNTTFHNELKTKRPKWYPKKDWDRKRKVIEDQLRIMRARWHISRYDAIQNNLVESESEREDGESGD